MNTPRLKWKCIERWWITLLAATLGCGAATYAEAANLTFIVGATNGVTNSEVVVPVRVRQFVNVSSFQFSFHWNTNIATYVGVERFGLPGLTNNNESFGTPFTSSGTLTVAWFEPNGGALTLADDSTVFGVRLRLVGPPAATSIATIDGVPTAIDAGNERLEHLPVSTVDGALNVDHTLLYLCPSDKIAECGTQWTFDVPIVFDSCSASTNGVLINVLSTVTNSPSTCGYTATRRWEILDQCSNRTVCTQTVTVVDTTAPVVTCSPDKTIELGTPWNFDAPMASDSCTPTANLITRIVSTSTNPGPCGFTFVATRTWDVLDGCSNKVTCTQVVTVRDTTAPSITCAPTKTVNCLAPWTFDTPTAIDQASGTVIPTQVISTFTNGTCGNNFFATRTWRATDACGNMAECSQTVFGRALVDVTGTIFVPTNYPASISDRRVPNATVLGPSNAVSAADGVYHAIFEAANNVVITPQGPGGNPSDGVTTLDISLVRRHILNVAQLDLPYKLVAGDVDGSSSVSTLDLSFMRRLILGATNRFPLGLWRFIPATHSFASPLAPWNPPTNRIYSNVGADITGQDYVAVKLGDVNTSWTPPIAGGAAQGASGGAEGELTPAGSSVDFTIGNTNAWPGNEVLVPIRVTGFSNVVGFQFSIHWNPAVAALVGLEQFGLPFNTSMYNLAMSNSGTLTVAWNDETGGMTTLADGTAIFFIRFTCVGSPSESTSISINGIPTAYEVAANNEVVPSSMTPGQITVNQPNRAPVLGNVIDRTVDEETLLGFTATVSDADAGQTQTFSLDAGAPAGASIHPGTGLFNWTPTEAQGAGTYSVTVRVTDNGTPAPLSDSRTITITVNEVNIPPTSTSDSFATDEDTPLAIVAPGVLANDSDGDGNPLSAVLVQSTSQGSLTLNANGSFTYTPAGNFNGLDTFTYRASDGVTNSPLTTVTITVRPVNDAPIAANDSYSVAEDATLSIGVPGVRSNDLDADGDAFTATLVSTTTNGSLTLQANGAFFYSPNTNFTGVDHFTYRINDGLATSAVAVVTINVNPVNDAPVAGNDNYATDEDVALSISAPGVLANDSDVDGNPLTVLLVITTTRGTLTLNANGAFTYSPTTSLFGADSFSYRITDGQATSAVVTASITVRSVNDTPIAVAESHNVSEDALLSIAAPGVLSNDSDQDGDALTAALVSGPVNGTLTLNANGSFTYRPATNFNGADSFTYRAGDGQTTSPPTTVSINVGPLNDAPVAVNDSYAVDEDTVFNIAAPGVRGNDSDVDGDALTSTVVTLPSNGVLSFNADGSFSYTPATNFNGVDSFTYRVSDGTAFSSDATVTINVRSINNTPVAANDGVYLAQEDLTLSVPGASGVLANDSDVDGDTLTPLLVTTTTNGTLTLSANGAFTYTPATNLNGSDAFTYRVTDGSRTSAVAIVTINVAAVNDVPTPLNDAYAMDEDTTLTIAAPGVLANDSDVESGSLTAVLVTGTAHGTLTLNADGSFTYQPRTNFFGTDTFTYRANDGVANSGICTATITVRGENDAPLTTNDLYVALEDTLLTISIAEGTLTNDVDPDGDTLSVLLAVTTTNGTLVLQTNGSFTYMPAPHFNGLDHFAYRLTDGIAISGLAVVTIEVAAVNDVPVVRDDSFAISEDATLVIGAPGLLANDSDADGDTMLPILIAAPIHGNVTVFNDGSFTYQAAANYTGPDSFSYQVNDGKTNSGVATVSITISGTNDAPVAVANSYSVDEDELLTVSAPGVLGDDNDSDGDALTATLVNGPAHGTMTLNANGSFTYLPAQNYSGPDAFSYRANDGQASSAPTAVSITVNPRNDPPAFSNAGTKRGVRGNVVTFTASANDPDMPQQTLTYSLDAAPSGASIDSASGVFTWLADVPAPSTNWVKVRVTDNGSPVQTTTVTMPIVIDQEIQLSIADINVPGGSDGSLEAIFEVTLSAPSSQAISVDFATADDTALAGVDYNAATGTLVIPPGITNATIDVTVIGNGTTTSNRSFFVNLSNPTNTTIVRTQAIGLITAEPATGLSLTDVVIAEPTGLPANAVFTVTLWPPTDRLVTVKYATRKGSAVQGKDFKPKRGTLRFNPGQTNISFAVPVVGDTLSESNEVFFVSLTRPVNSVIATPTVTGTIIDDDALPEISIVDAMATETDAGARALAFWVQLSAKSGQTITVDFQTQDGTATAGTDYQATSGTLIFTPKQTRKYFVVPVAGDAENEGTETFYVHLSNAVNVTIFDGDAIATIRDDEASLRAGMHRVRILRRQP